MGMVYLTGSAPAFRPFFRMAAALSASPVKAFEQFHWGILQNTCFQQWQARHHADLRQQDSQFSRTLLRQITAADLL